MAGIIGTGNTVKLGRVAYAAAGKSKDANLALAKEIITVRGVNPAESASKMKVTEIWATVFPADQTGEGKTFDLAIVKSIKNAVNYIVRDLDCRARGTTLADVLKDKRDKAREEAKAARELAERTGNGDNGKDPISYGKHHPVEAAAMITALLSGILSAVNSPADVDTSHLKASLATVRDGLGETAKALAERMTNKSATAA